MHLYLSTLLWVLSVIRHSQLTFEQRMQWQESFSYDLRLCLCMYVCISAWMFECVYIYIVCLCACVCLCVYISMNMYFYVRVCVQMSREWVHGVCGCTQNVPWCCITCWLPCVTSYRVGTRLGMKMAAIFSISEYTWMSINIYAAKQKRQHWKISLLCGIEESLCFCS